MYVVEDDEGIYRMRGNTCRLWAGADLHPALGDLEGIAADDRARRLYALAEESGELVTLTLEAAPRVRSLGTIPRPGQRANKGFEGLAFLPARLSPNGRASFVAAHEGKPRRVRLFAAKDLAQTHDLKLPDDAKHALEDLADVTVDPVSGALLLLSEESRRIGIFTFEAGALALRDLIDVRVTDDARPEGLDFVTPSRLVVVTEGPATMIDLRVSRVLGTRRVTRLA
jgi:uncharacterized protein YjiK